MKNKVCGIYLIIRKGKAHFYVGSSLDVDRRLKEHRKKLRAGRHDNIHLQNAFNLYGEEAFTFELFEEFPPDQVRHFEQVALNYLGKLPFCYNINLDASVPPSQKGKKLSPETKAKMSQAKKGKVPSPEMREKMSSAHKGKKLSPETRAKMSEAKMGNTWWKGKRHSPESIARMSEAKKNNTYSKGKVLSPETKAKMSEGQKRRQARERLEREQAQNQNV